MTIIIMKIKYICSLLLALTLIAMTSSCGNEHLSGDGVDLTNEFAIEDDATDEVQHERYLIYQEYGVPVLFNDTITVREIGTDLYGNPIKQYETVDLNWDFDSYSNSVTYKYDYLTSAEDRMKALHFVRQFLEQCSKRMRPFSIMVADSVSTEPESKSLAEKKYISGFRTLVFYNVTSLDDSEITATATEVINDMVIQKVKADRDLCSQFEEVSSKYYYRAWEDMGGCSTLLAYKELNSNVSPNTLFYGDPYNAVEGSTAVHRIDLCDLLMSRNLVANREEAEKVRSAIVTEIGNYGFIRGNKNTGALSPTDAEEDRNYFIQAILTLGAEGFQNRYGRCLPVMTKYKLLYNFITNELGITL